MHYDTNPESYLHFDEEVHGIVPFRGLWKQTPQQSKHIISSNGYFQFTSKKEMLAHFHNELYLFPEIGGCLGHMSVNIDEKTILFEGDRCVCQWKIWG